jgi:hypothetical protein
LDRLVDMKFLAFGRVGLAMTCSVVLGVLGACGSDSSCEDTRSCGSGAGGKTDGGGGTGGTSGDSGSDAPVACDKNEDCEDGNACNGVATCVAHVCQAGTPKVCTNPDTIHCVVSCIDPAGDCQVAAADVDGDQHGDELCAEAPGDDCDDTEAAAYTGADEICDGIDNDCNGKADLQDGLALTGTSEDFVTSTDPIHSPSITWASDIQKYGVVWDDQRIQAGDQEVFFTLMSPTGAKVGNELQISSSADASEHARVAWGNDSFGVVWDDDRFGNPDIFFRRLDENGAPLTAEVRLTTDAAHSEYPDIVAIPTGWLVIFADKTTASLQGIRLNADGTVAKAKTKLGTHAGAFPRVAVLGTDVGVVWSELGSPSAPYRVGRLHSDFDFVATGETYLTPLPSNNAGPLLADIVADATTNGFKTVYFNKDVPTYLGYAELDSTTSPTCGPAESGNGVELGSVGGIVPYATGSVFLFATDVGAADTAKINLGSFEPGCGSFFEAPIDTGITIFDPQAVDAASGDLGVALIWQDYPNKIRRRVIGPHLCD